MPRPNLNMQTFDPLQENGDGTSVDVAEVFQLVMWFRHVTRNDHGGLTVDAPFWYDDDFIPVASTAVSKASAKIRKLGFCQQRVWEVVTNRIDGVPELVPFVSALECFPQLRHNKHKSCIPGDNHKSCTAGDDNKSCTPGEDHESCTPGFCEYATLNFTSVDQLHKCSNKGCGLTTEDMFEQSLLVEALKDPAKTTAWALDGKSLVARGTSYLAVSHVWSDGTGAGKWEAGHVNKCLWQFFVDQATRLECVGVWWDAVCIPRDKAARSIALNNMHDNYKFAKYTMVHDLYLAGVEWESDDGSPCIALVLSPWFTRGWTALELFLSETVFILFREGNGYTLKDLDKEVLAQHQILHSHAHWIATDAIKRLRFVPPTFDNGQEPVTPTFDHGQEPVTPTFDYGQEPVTPTFHHGQDLLSALRGRYTSWSRDKSIIAGLMCGLTTHVSLPEQDITKEIVRSLKTISYDSLLHGLPTMSEPEFSWCPPRFVDIPSSTSPGSRSAFLTVQDDGMLSGYWKVWYMPDKSYVDRKMIWSSSTDIYVWTQVQWTLQNFEQCLILTCDTYDSQGLLVRPRYRTEQDGLHSEYIGPVNFSQSGIRKARLTEDTHVFIGYKPYMGYGGDLDEHCRVVFWHKLPDMLWDRSRDLATPYAL